MQNTNKPKIAIFHWGELSIHSYYLASQLQKENIDVDFFLYTPAYANKNPHINVTLNKLKKEVTLYQFTSRKIEDLIIKLNFLFRLFKIHFPLLYINPFLPSKTRKSFNAKNYQCTITITQSSLYWLHKVNKSALKNNLHYSLEIEKITDPGMSRSLPLYCFIQQEAKLLRFSKGLIIQDALRAKALLNDVTNYKNLQFIYLPVSIPGKIIEHKSDYLHEKLCIGNNTAILLYFGAIYRERKIDELVEEVERFSANGSVLVLHGKGEFSHIIKNPEKVKASNELLAFEDISKIIASADIGLAFYDNSWPNTRLTAFSSEKIARYLQAGVPFIAFKNESYDLLYAEFKCCELIGDLHELQDAVNRIQADYDFYKSQCYEAYEKYYNIKNAIKPLAAYIKNMAS